MVKDGLRTAVFLACVTGIVAGCRVPPAPGGQNDPYKQQPEAEDGWLFDRMMGRSASTEKADSGVQQASATESVYPPQGSMGGDGENIEKALHTTPVDGQDKPAKEEEGGFSLSALAPSKIYESAKTAAGYGRDEKLAKQLFEEGQELYRQEKYEEAADKFATAAARWPDTALEEDALFYQGESLFFANKYVAANDAFGQLMKKYDNSRYLDQAVRRQFNIARYWEQLQEKKPLWTIVPNVTDSTRPTFDTWGNALKVYEGVQLHDPTGPLADDAVMALGNAQFVAGHYEDAAYQYDMLRKEYPQSEHQYDAHRLALKSKMLTYQGPYYDGTALEQSGEIADQTLRQFRAEMGDEKQRVVDEKNTIVEKLAERDWTIGQYYDKKGYYGAARLYYQGLVDNTRLAGTSFAEKARRRLVEIKDKPDKPTNHFKWLTNLFPSSG